MFRIEYHCHSNYSSDSDALMEEMVKSAIDKNINEIAITDHVDYDDRYEVSNYNDYINDISIIKEKYSKKISVIYGIEIGLDNTKADVINEFSKSYPFDFIIGSSHAVLGKDLYFDNYFEGMDKFTSYTKYFDEMLKNIKTCLSFCVYGHIDFISRYGIYNDNSLKYSDFSNIIDNVLKELIIRGKGIEINTSGYRYGINQTYPSFEILKRYKELGGEILTIGSDAHNVFDIANNFDVAYDMAKQAGFKYITRFKALKPYFVLID